MNGLTAVDLTGVASLDDGLWHLVGGVYDPEFGNARGPRGRMFIYVDGQEDISVPVYGQLQCNGYDVCIGANAQMMDRKHRGSCFSGSIDEVRIYNYALGAEEIAALFEADR